VTRAHRKAGTLLEAVLARCARRRDLGLRRVAAAVVLAVLGGALALSCCFDEPAPESGAGDIMTDWAAPAPASLDDPGPPAGRRIALDELPSSMSAQVSVQDGRGLSAADPCDSSGVAIEVGTEVDGRAAPTPFSTAGVVTPAAAGPPALVDGGRVPLSDHLTAQLSPYRLCVMRT
jgi:hypothetical protein